MRVVLLGDSHLARVRRDLHRIWPEVCNAARGGSRARDLLPQAASATVTGSDVVVMSVGTNDAAPWKQVPVESFADLLLECLQSAPAGRRIYLAPPGVDEQRLTGPRDRTNATIDEYREAAISACSEAEARVVRTDRVIEPIGSGAFVDDGLHLSGPAYQLVLPAIAEAVRAAV